MATETKTYDLNSVIPKLTWATRFVPLSDSRCAADKLPSLNWEVTFATAQGTITADYTQGVGNLPGYVHNSRRTVADAEDERAACERGDRYRGRKIQPPDPAHVMRCLLDDAQAIDYPDFESWARDMDSDPDSRKAERMYKACLEIGLKLRRMLGEDGMSRLRELLADLQPSRRHGRRHTPAGQGAPCPSQGERGLRSAPPAHNGG